jgi:hypothetical protein
MAIGIVGTVAYLLIASVGGTVFLTWGSWRRYRRINATQAVTCAQLGQAEGLPRWVTVTARTGGRQMLRAPRSGRACVWFQVDYERSPNPGEPVNRWLDLPEESSLVPVTDGIAMAHLTARLAQTRLIGSTLAVATVSGRDGDATWREVIIPPDVPIFVRARPVVSGRRTTEPAGVVLDTGWSAPCGVSLRSAEQTRRGFATRVGRSLAALLGAPVLGVVLLLAIVGWQTATR